MSERTALINALTAQLAEAGLSEATAVSSGAEGQQFGNTAVTFRLDTLLLRFIRDRGQWFLEFAMESAPNYFYQYDDVEIAMGWSTIEQVLCKREAEDLSIVLGRLHAHFDELNDACGGGHAELTKARFERAARERGKAFTDRLRGKE